MNETEYLLKEKSAKINNALGFFILAFGLIVLVAMFLPENIEQRITNILAGAVLLAIGGGMMWKAQSTLKKLKREKPDQ